MSAKQLGSQKAQTRQNKTGVHLMLLLCSIAFALPFYWLVSTAVKPETQIFAIPPEWVPHPVIWENFPKALTYIPYGLYTWNTLVICTLSVIGVVFASSLVAYSLAKVPWKGRNFVFATLIVTMVLPPQVTMIPTFAIFRALHWIGTNLPLWVPSFFGSAFSIFLLRQFFMTLPNELCDAARLDGCTDWAIYWRMVLPLSKPALVTVGLFQFIGAWNDFLGPLLYLNDERSYTLSIGLQRFVSQHGAEWGMLMAASVVMTLPIILIFFFAQRTFIEGVTLTGIKG